MKRFILPLMILLFVGSLLAVESAPSEVVGYVKYDCLAGLNHIALPMDQGYTWVSEFADDYMGNMDTMSYWDATSQSWVAAVDLGYWEGDFAVESGSVIMVNAITPFTAYSIGQLPVANASYSLIPGLNDLMIPLNRSDIAWAGAVGDEIGLGSLDTISYWDATSQTWVAAVDLGYWEGDFEVAIGDPMQVNSLTTTTWPSRGSLNTLIKSTEK
jgi:hypothetical protein